MRVASLHTYPVKGCHRLDHDRIGVEPWGLSGDRRWVITDPDGGFVSQRTAPALAAVRPTPGPDGSLLLRAPGRAGLSVPRPEAAPNRQVTVWRSTLAATAAGPAADRWLSEVLARPVRLSWLDDPTRRLMDPANPHEPVSFADSCPVTVGNLASLDQLNQWLGEAGADAVPMTRFRPNIVVADAPAWAEDGWVGRLIQVGPATFRVVKPAGRCQVVNIDQETGQQRGRVLAALGEHRRHGDKMLFAVHLIPETAAAITVGDRVVAG